MDRINIIHCPVADVGKHLISMLADGRVFIICDSNVRGLAERTWIKAKGVFEIEATEQGKSLETVLAIDSWLLEQGADRNAFVLGIGGGITTDMTGFAASVYKRGVRFAFVPTTLLSQVDAAIGGKNGVNLDSYKNIIGVIRQPEAVFICPEPLDTLPYPQIISGAAELLKTFIIQNEDDSYAHTVKVLSGIRESKSLGDSAKELNDLVAKAALIKAGIAGRDPEEHGERRLLNLGHTFAHAIEKMSSERIAHGEAVSMGIILAARLAEKMDLAKKGLAARLEADFTACGMPTACPFNVGELTDAMRKDKKAEGGNIHFVLPLGIGKVETMILSPEYVTGLLEQ